ncbi:sulfatase family protein [Nocardioides sp.]|uniref:sulfatase family protein n=1 Tax=Nocardioides sp. TaxID=35761 RepID=UPI003D0EFF11
MLAVTAITALAAAGLAACDGGSEPRPKAERTHHSVTTGPQPVPSPGAQDQISLTDPVSPSRFTAPAKPNLLMITVDDAAQVDLRYMPHVQRLLADQGVTLNNGIAPTPICVPARASLISGQYAHNHGALTINGAGGGFEAFQDDDTLPVWLQKAGYDTLFIGKYLNGYGERGSNTYVPPGWTDWRATVDPTTYNFLRPTVNNNGTNVRHDEYSSNLFSDLSTDMLSAPQRKKRPWYLWVNYVAPHTGGPNEADDPVNTHPDDPKPVKTTTPDKRDQNTFSDLALPDKPNMFENTDDKAIIRATHRVWSEDRKEELVEAHQQRVEALQSVDRAVARTVQTLRRTGQLDNTYIVFTSDNGYVLGEHNLEGKLWYFREIVGIPMYVRGPGLRAGSVSSTPVTNADWAPTFAALAGATPTRPVDGLDVMPWLEGPATTRVVPIEAYPVQGGTTPRYTGVVVGPWTYVRSIGGREELYYRKVDPWQINNLRRDPRFRTQLRALSALTDQYADCAASTCPSDFYR